MAINYGGLLGKIIPESYGLSDQDKNALARQGLLSLGLGILGSKSGGNFGTSLADGLKSGLLAINSGAEDVQSSRYKQQALQQQLGGGTDFRALDAKARAAGYEPGTDDYKRAFQVALGTQGRASSAGYGFDQLEDASGSKRPTRTDPRTGNQEVFVEEESRWVPLGSTPIPQAPAPAPNIAAQIGQQATQSGQPDASHFGAFNSLAMEFPNVSMTSAVRSPERNAAVGGQPNSQHLRGTAADYAVPPQLKPAFMSRVRQLGYTPIDEGDHVHIQLPRGGASTTGIGRSRTKEQEAAAVEAAKLGVQQQYLPTELGMRTDAALQQEAGKLGVQQQADRSQKAFTRTRDADESLGLVSEALKLLPQATGSRTGALWDEANAAVGRSTQGAQANAQLKILSAGLIAKVPRMEGPQSDADVKMYRDAAGDLANENLPVATREAAARQLVRLQRKYATQQGNSPAPAASSGPRRLKFNPATGKIE